MSAADPVLACCGRRERRRRLTSGTGREARQQAADVTRPASRARSGRRVGALQLLELAGAAFADEGVERHDAMVGAGALPRAISRQLDLGPDRGARSFAAKARCAFAAAQA